MSPPCPTASLPVTAAQTAQPTAIRGPFAALERLLNTAGFVSVDLADTIFASLPNPPVASREAAQPPKTD